PRRLDWCRRSMTTHNFPARMQVLARLICTYGVVADLRHAPDSPTWIRAVPGRSAASGSDTTFRASAQFLLKDRTHSASFLAEQQERPKWKAFDLRIFGHVPYQ